MHYVNIFVFGAISIVFYFTAQLLPTKRDRNIGNTVAVFGAVMCVLNVLFK